MKDATMPEPTTSGAGGFLLAAKYGLVAKLVALVGSGVLGALIIAAFDPPKSRKGLFAQAAVAGVMSILFTSPLVRWVDHTFDFIDLASGELYSYLEVVLPVGFLVGSLSWGVMGALVKLRQIVRERGAQAVAGKVGLGDES